jgi:excinuclease ABC subunit B
MPEFKVVSDFLPTGDQPQAIDLLVEGLLAGYEHQTLLGATGTGKTYTIAKVVERVQRPTLVMVHNKTLAAQLYSEFREFFPHNAVEYYVSYYDYYQPEAYLPRSDTYIEKDADINDEINKLRLAATEALLTRRDVILVASVSAIYSIGSPEEYGREVVELRLGEIRRRDSMLRHLVAIHYDRNDVAFKRGTFRVRGDTVDVFPAYRDTAVRVEFWGDTVERLTEIDPLTGEILEERQAIQIYPAKHFVTTAEAMTEAITHIEAELEGRLAELNVQDKLLEAQRLEQRTLYDIEMMREIGYCSGIENYSRHLANRKPGDPPWTLIDYFPDDFLIVLDESHMMVPQIRGMYNGDRSRKEVLVEFGFRLPSALDNRPLQFHEFEERLTQAIYTSATWLARSAAG